MTDPRTDFCFYDERFVIETGILKYCEKYGVSSLKTWLSIDYQQLTLKLTIFSQANRTI